MLANPHVDKHSASKICKKVQFLRRLNQHFLKKFRMEQLCIKGEGNWEQRKKSLILAFHDFFCKIIFHEKIGVLERKILFT